MITWYKSAILGCKLHTGTSKTKLVNLFIVLDVPVGNLRPSMADLYHVITILQRAHSLSMTSKCRMNIGLCPFSGHDDTILSIQFLDNLVDVYAQQFVFSHKMEACPFLTGLFSTRTCYTDYCERKVFYNTQKSECVLRVLKFSLEHKGNAKRMQNGTLKRRVPC